MVAKPTKNTPTFEEAMARLEECVNQLERNALPLQEAVQRFAEGMELVRSCNERLHEAQQQVEKLVEENGEWLKQPFLSSARGNQKKNS